MHESGHKRCRDGSIKNDTDMDASLNTANQALNSGQNKIIEDAQALTKQTSLPVVDNAEQRSASIGNKDSNVQKTDEEIVQPAGVQDRDETKSKSKASLAMLEEQKVLKFRERVERALMPAMLQNNSANAPTPDAENALGDTVNRHLNTAAKAKNHAQSKNRVQARTNKKRTVLRHLTIFKAKQASESDCGEKTRMLRTRTVQNPQTHKSKEPSLPARRRDRLHNSKKSFS